MMKLEISGHSTAMYSTFWFIEPLGILFDCGDGAASFLGQRGRKVKHVICSHPDRDHLGGLFQFLQLNCHKGGPTVFYPKDSGSFPAIENFLNKFDSHISDHVNWRGLADGDRIELKPNYFLECYANRHVPHPEGSSGVDKSLSYSLIAERKKLKPELLGLSGPEIGALREEKGDDHIRNTVVETIMTYSGDTPLEPAEFWRNPKVLIHEATFLCRETAASRGQDVRHSVLDDVIEMATKIESLQQLVLGHFSCRYGKEEIADAITHSIAKHGLKIPVAWVAPGESSRKLVSIEL